MNSDNSLVHFIYELRKRNINIWHQEESIKAFIPDGECLTDNEKEFIKLNKQNLIKILNDNEINSKNEARKVLKSYLNYSCPLSYQQERLWFIEQYEGGTNLYNISRVYKLAKDIDYKIIEQAISQIVKRHEILRSNIRSDDYGNGYFEIDSNFVKIPIDYKLAKTKHQLNQLIAEKINYVFDLSKEYPINLLFIEYSSENSPTFKEVYVVILFHHIAFDGWSIEVFANELREICFSLISSKIPTLPELKVQYKDFAFWQKSYLVKKTLQPQIDYWQKKLSQYEILNLPKCYDRPEEMEYEGDNIYFELDEKTSKGLKGIAQSMSTSLYSILLGGYIILLNYITNQNDIIIGTVIANRFTNEIENLLGFFVNTIPLRFKVKSEEFFKDFIENLSEDILNAKLNQDMPFEKLLHCLDVPSDKSMHPLFQVMFVVNGFNQEKSNDISYLLEEYPLDNANITAKFDLTTTWNDSNEILACNFNFRKKLFKKSKINNFINIYKKILAEINNLISKKVSYDFQISYLLNQLDSKSHINKEYLDYPKDKTLFSMFEEQAESTPDAIAIIDSTLNKEYLYHELASDVKKLSHYLIDQNIYTSEQLVAVLSEKGYNHPISTLSIMKIGCAYLPLHHEWPAHRIDEVLTQGNVKTILISRNCFDQLGVGNVLYKKYNLIIIEDILATDSGSLIETNIKFPSVSSTDVAYVIFTSGSTGKPKGVTISHQGAINTIYAVNKQFNVTSNDSILALSELSFDLSVYDIFGLLSQGGTIVFPNSDFVKDPAHWYELISKYHITIWDTVPQLAGLLVENTEDTIESLRLFLLSGDWIPVKLPDQIKNICPSAKVISLGGATEGSIWSIWYEINYVDKNWKSIPYGVSMPNQTMLVLNENNNSCPIGVIGEIHIGGDGVALNYWRDYEKTNSSFILTEEFGRIYKTGDLGRWSENGYIEFMGRKDTQVKLHGYRIELDEISHHLSKFDGIDDAVSTLLEVNNQHKICSYYTGKKYDSDVLLNELRLTLPSYMVPAIIIHLTKMPLSSNGKLDRSKLPNPESLIQCTSYIAPANDLENIICKAFASVLNITDKQISVMDDFFALGGDSIASISLLSYLRKEHNLIISAKNVFSCRTVSEICKKIEFDCEKKYKLISEAEITSDEFNLLPIQEWFFSLGLSDINFFNHSFIVKVPPLDISLLKIGIDYLFNHHDALKIKFKSKFSGYNQYYNTNHVDYKINILDVNTLEESKTTIRNVLTSWQSIYDITEGPLWSIGYLYGYEDGSARLHIAIHHLLIDTVSWRILIRDLQSTYNSLINNKKPSLGKKGTSYRQWINLINSYESYYPKEIEYWQDIRNELKNKNSIEKKYDILETYNSSSFHFDEKATSTLLQANTVVNTQVNELLLTVLGVTLFDVTGQRINYITLEGHGREDIYESVDISETVGWFTTMYPLRLEIFEGCNWIPNIKLVKENLRSIPNKGIGYGALFGYEIEKMPKVVFNYLGQFEYSHASSEWSFVNEESGTSISKRNLDNNIISINAAIVENKLQLSIKCKLDMSITIDLTKRFEAHLHDLIRSLQALKHKELTMSDFIEYEPFTRIDRHVSSTICLLPPGVGGYECYIRNIVPKLSGNLILFNNFNYFLRKEIEHNLDLSYLSFENLADNYIAQLKIAQRSGPYILFGWSFGGVLAFEICKRLLERGENVTNLFLVDPYFNVNEVFNMISQNINKVDVVGHLNLKYHPEYTSLLKKVRISLFKATKLFHGDNNELFNFYVLKKEYNSLDFVVPKEDIVLEHLDSDHFGWIENNCIVEQVASHINDAIDGSV